MVDLRSLRVPTPHDVLDVARRPVRSGLAGLFESDRFPQEQYDEPAGDPGLFGPDSVTWRVHADPSMFVGGITALMLQALHPLAAAGVSDNSRFRKEPLRRLSRTGSFVAATTYASTPVAESVIATVRKVHERVRGIAPDGRAYSANDPRLLTWVHVAEVASFLRAHRRYTPFPLRGADLDRYFAETSVVATRLGAVDVPTSRNEVREYFHTMAPELEVGEHAREMFTFLCQPIERDPVTRSVHGLLIQAAVGLLPSWAQGMHGATVSPLTDRTVVRPATWTALQTMRLALGPSPVLTAAHRRALAGAV